MSKKPTFLTGYEGRKIAYHKIEAKGPTVLFCGGYMSDMEGTKALYLEATCRTLGLSYVRFDYVSQTLSDLLGILSIVFDVIISYTFVFTQISIECIHTATQVIAMAFAQCRMSDFTQTVL